MSSKTNKRNEHFTTLYQQPLIINHQDNNLRNIVIIIIIRLYN